MPRSMTDCATTGLRLLMKELLEKHNDGSIKRLKLIHWETFLTLYLELKKAGGGFTALSPKEVAQKKIMKCEMVSDFWFGCDENSHTTIENYFENRFGSLSDVPEGIKLELRCIRNILGMKALPVLRNNLWRKTKRKKVRTVSNAEG